MKFGGYFIYSLKRKNAQEESNKDVIIKKKRPYDFKKQFDGKKVITTLTARYKEEKSRRRGNSKRSMHL